jgi:hypothetical protein
METKDRTSTRQRRVINAMFDIGNYLELDCGK